MSESSKPPLLYLVHRIPFPPNKGDKIRSYNVLRELNKHYSVHLVCFLDGPHDQQYIPALEKECASLYVETQHKLTCLIKSAKGLVNGRPLSVPYYSSTRMQKQVDTLINLYHIEHAVVFSSTMGQFLNKHPEVKTLIDFVDVDSDKWRQYAEKGNPLKRWVYRREHQTLEREEQRLCERAAFATFVSPQEADLFKRLMPDPLKDKIGYLYNGVDTDYFDPHAADITPLTEQVDVCFTGAMDYWANVDAVLWFADNVWPTVRKHLPTASFYIVGGNPTEKVSALNGKQGIKVTGRVADVRPYALAAKVNVAPLQIARGIQNKVLEAMALAKPVVATSLAIEGIQASNAAVIIKDHANEYAQAVIQQIQQPTDAQVSREWILDNLRWDNALKALPALISGSETVCD